MPSLSTRASGLFRRTQSNPEKTGLDENTLPASRGWHVWRPWRTPRVSPQQADAEPDPASQLRYVVIGDGGSLEGLGEQTGNRLPSSSNRANSMTSTDEASSVDYLVSPLTSGGTSSDRPAQNAQNARSSLNTQNTQNTQNTSSASSAPRSVAFKIGTQAHRKADNAADTRTTDSVRSTSSQGRVPRSRSTSKQSTSSYGPSNGRSDSVVPDAARGSPSPTGSPPPRRTRSPSKRSTTSDGTARSRQTSWQGQRDIPTNRDEARMRYNIFTPVDERMRYWQGPSDHRPRA